MYACPQSLAPRTLLADMKGGLRKAGIRPPQGVQPVPVKESREYRKVPGRTPDGTSWSYKI